MRHFVSSASFIFRPATAPEQVQDAISVRPRDMHPQFPNRKLAHDDPKAAHVIIVGMAADNEVNYRLLGIPSADVCDHFPSGILVAAVNDADVPRLPVPPVVRIASPLDAPSPTRKNSISYGTISLRLRQTPYGTTNRLSEGPGPYGCV